MILTPQEAINGLNFNPEVERYELEDRKMMKEKILMKIHQSIKKRRFLFLTDNSAVGFIYLGFPVTYTKYEAIFDEIKKDMNKLGWSCYHQTSSCGFGTYYSFCFKSDDFNAKTIEYTTTNDLSEFLY